MLNLLRLLLSLIPLPPLVYSHPLLPRDALRCLRVRLRLDGSSLRNLKLQTALIMMHHCRLPQPLRHHLGTPLLTRLILVYPMTMKMTCQPLLQQWQTNLSPLCYPHLLCFPIDLVPLYPLQSLQPLLFQTLTTIFLPPMTIIGHLFQLLLYRRYRPHILLFLAQLLTTLRSLR